MRRWIKRIAMTAVTVLTVGAGFSWWAVQQTRHVPEFYQRATGEARSGNKSTGRVLLDTSVEPLDFAADQPVVESWNAVFTVD